MKNSTIRMWMRPGMKIKRWIALFMLAAVLTSLAAAMGLAWLYENYQVPEAFQDTIGFLTLQFVPHPLRGLIMLSMGLLLFGFALWRISHSLFSPLLKEITSGRTVAEIYVGDRFGPTVPEFNVVTIGGGTGLGNLLRGLKQANINLTAIVTVADDGALIVTGIEAAQIGDIAASHAIRLHELSPQRARLEAAFMERTRDSVEYHAGADEAVAAIFAGPTETATEQEVR